MGNQQTDSRSVKLNNAPQYQADQKLSAMNWWKIATIVLSVVLILLVGVGVYILGSRREEEISNLSTSTPAKKSGVIESPPVVESTASSSEKTVIDWKSQTLEIIHESAFAGKQTLSMEIRIPEGWTLQTYSRKTDPNSLIKNCSDYVITSPTGDLSLQLSPICSGWAARYSSVPSDAVIVSQQRQIGDDGLHNYYRVRYETSPNNYSYVDAMVDPDRSLDKDRDKIMDAVLIGYPSSNETINTFFIAAYLTATYHPAAGEKEKFLSIADQIAASLTLR